MTNIYITDNYRTDTNSDRKYFQKSKKIIFLADTNNRFKSFVRV